MFQGTRRCIRYKAAGRGVGSGLCIWKKLGDISVGSWKVFKEGTKHPAPKLKHTGALKMHSHRICFCSVSNLRLWASQLPILDFSASQRPGLGEGFLLAKDTVTPSTLEM